MNETWPEFVTDEEEAEARELTPPERTGWERVVFELQDTEVDRLLSALAERLR